jgi:hypothetical protein
MKHLRTSPTQIWDVDYKKNSHTHRQSKMAIEILLPKSFTGEIMDKRRILDAMFDYNAQVDLQSIYTWG